MTREERLAVRMKLYEGIANGNGPLDKIERFCRERGIVYYCDFINAVLDEDEELAAWVLKPGRGVEARTRGIKARIANVRYELKKGV